MPKIIINGKEIEFQKGMTVLQACELADVEIPSRKIGFIRIGQAVDISIDSFPSTDFGVLKGNVLSVGSDALPPDPQKQRDSYNFPATIYIENQYLTIKNGIASIPISVFSHFKNDEQNLRFCF